MILVSKEILIMNEEFLMVSNFAAMFLTMYLLLGDTVVNAAQESANAEIKQENEASDLAIDVAELRVKGFEGQIQAVQVLKNLKKDYNELALAAQVARANKAKVVAIDAYTQKLEAAKQREIAEALEKNKQLVQEQLNMLKENF